MIPVKLQYPQRLNISISDSGVPLSVRERERERDCGERTEGNEKQKS
jgi:anti-sigma regulatory factor (Ser/Thr protein kinase)